MHTYDFTDEQIDRLKDAVERMQELPDADTEWTALQEKLNNPTCSSYERVVHTPTAFREFWNSDDDPDTQWVCEVATDDMIDSMLGDGPLYDAWAQVCESCMTELLHHLNKLKNGEGGLSLPTKE